MFHQIFRKNGLSNEKLVFVHIACLKEEFVPEKEQGDAKPSNDKKDAKPSKNKGDASNTSTDKEKAEL
jgi:hypothetical protein